MMDLLDRIVLRGASQVVDVFDPTELDSDSSMTRRLASNMQMYSYKLLDRSLLRQRFQQPIVRHTTYDLGAVLMCNVGDRFATRLDIGSESVDEFCFNRMIAGFLTALQNGKEATSRGTSGLALRARGGTRTISSDESGRSNIWIDAGFLERSLEQLIGDKLRRPLEFRLDVKWDRGLAASVDGLFRYLTTEIGRPDGLASNSVALASFHDALVRAVLHGLPNNYSDRLLAGPAASVPGYVYRANEFMRAHASDPVRMRDVAAASGCSVRTLEMAYRRFRDTTPLAALLAIRLDRARADLQRGEGDASVGEVARRYGFSNRQRFRVAYARRFGSLPARQ